MAPVAGIPGVRFISGRDLPSPDKAVALEIDALEDFCASHLGVWACSADAGPRTPISSVANNGLRVPECRSGVGLVGGARHVPQKEADQSRA